MAALALRATLRKRTSPRVWINFKFVNASHHRVRTGVSRTHHRLALRALVILECLSVFAYADISDKELQNLVDQSTLIFKGKVLGLGSNVESIDIKEGPMIVRVERVDSDNHGALKKFGSLDGKELTVVIEPSSRIQAPKEGTYAVFFVNPLFYERNIAVTANAIADDKTELDLSKRISEAVERKDEMPLKDAVASADRIVIGTVKEVTPLPEAKLVQLRSFADGRDILSEHSPRWKEALILVQSELKGEPKAEPGEKIKTVIVVFPSTDDRMWADSPKFSVGQDGIWLLHDNEVAKEEVSILLAPQKFHDRETKAYTTMRAEDFLPKDPDGKNEARIRKIIESLSP